MGGGVEDNEDWTCCRTPSALPIVTNDSNRPFDIIYVKRIPILAYLSSSVSEVTTFIKWE